MEKGTLMGRSSKSIPGLPPSCPATGGQLRPAAVHGRPTRSGLRHPAAANRSGQPMATPPSYSHPAQHFARSPATSGLRENSQVFEHDPEYEGCEHETSLNDAVDRYEASMYNGLNFTNLLDGENNDQTLLNYVGFNKEESQDAPTHDTNFDEPVSARHKQKRSKNFSEEEDMLLVSAWINVGQDPVQGTNQSRNTYWGRIYEYFHKHKTFNSDRNQNSLNKRWTLIQEAVNRFFGCLSRIEARRQSGKTIQDKLVDAQSLFKAEDPKSNGFSFMHCWKELQFQQKWIDKERELAAPKRSNKRQKEQADSNTQSSNPMSIQISNPISTPSNVHDENATTPEYNRLGRPPGVKRAKKDLAHGHDNRYAEAVDRLWEKKKVADDERFTQLCQLEKDRVQKDMELREKEVAVREKEAAAAREKEAVTREKEATAREKEAEARSKDAERKLMLEEKCIINLDFSSLSVQVHDYYTRLQEEIMSRRFG